MRSALSSETQPPGAPADSVKRLLPWLVAVAFFMESLDTTILNTAVPVVSKALGVSLLSMKAVLASYTLSLAVFIPASGWIGDRFGAKRVMLVAILIFTVASALCGVASSLDELVAYLKGGGKFKLAASAEFVSSPAALPAFEQTYGFHLSADQILTLSGGNTATTLRAAAEGISGVNAAMAYGTDGELAALGLTALCDDKGAQVVYAPTPVIREPVLGAHPAIGPTLDPIFASLTLETLQQLNARIAVGGEQPEAVAGSYLKSKHFLP